MSESYNGALCEERHTYIKEEFESMDRRLKKAENRFLMIMTTLCITLIGVIANLIVLLNKGTP